MTRHSRDVPTLALAALAALWSCSDARRPRAPTTLPGGFVVESPGFEDALPGDLVLAGPSLRVVVGGPRRATAERGVIVAVQHRRAPQGALPVTVTPLVWVNGEPHGVTVERAALSRRAGAAALRVEGHVTLSGRAWPWVEDLSLAEGEPGLVLQARLYAPEGTAPGDVRLGARLSWGGPGVFVPGEGVLTDEGWHDAVWLGASGRRAALAYGASTASRARAVFERHGGARALAWSDVVSPTRYVASSRAYAQRAWLAAGLGELSAPVRALGALRGSPFPEVRVVLPYAPEGATVHLSTVEGRALVRARPGPDGVAVLPLTALPGERPGGRYAAVALAWGHHASDAVLFRPPVDRELTLSLPRGSALRLTAVDARTGAFLPARARVLGVHGTAAPNLGPEWRGEGARDVVLLPSGRATVNLPPGRYRVILTRGPEWSLHDEEVAVTETYRPEVRAELARVMDPGDWVASDFHLHAAPSPDSEVTLEDRVAALAAEGVRFVVPTDHNHVTDYAPALELQGYWDMGTVPGVEVTTFTPGFGHFNAWPLAPDPTRPGQGAPDHALPTPAAIFAAVHARGPDVMLQVNHPRLEGDIGYFDRTGYDPATGRGGALFSPDFDVLEVWNGFELGRPARLDQVLRDWYSLLASGRRVVATGNSDSHDVRFQWAGYPRTYVRVPGGRVDEPLAVVRALRAGRAFVTSGPLLDVTVEGQGPGDTVALEGREARVRVQVRAPPWMDVSRVDVLVGGEVAHSEPVPRTEPRDAVVRFERELLVPVRPPTFVTVRASGEAPLSLLLARDDARPVAFTNPIWVTARSPLPRPARPRANVERPSPSRGSLAPGVAPR